MKLLQSLLFAVIAVTSTFALAESGQAVSQEQTSSAYPTSPVGNPFIE